LERKRNERDEGGRKIVLGDHTAAGQSYWWQGDHTAAGRSYCGWAIILAAGAVGRSYWRLGDHTAAGRSSCAISGSGAPSSLNCN